MMQTTQDRSSLNAMVLWQVVPVPLKRSRQYQGWLWYTRPQ